MSEWQEIEQVIRDMRTLIDVGCPVDAWRRRMGELVDRLDLAKPFPAPPLTGSGEASNK